MIVGCQKIDYQSCTEAQPHLIDCLPLRQRKGKARFALGLLRSCCVRTGDSGRSVTQPGTH